MNSPACLILGFGSEEPSVKESAASSLSAGSNPLTHESISLYRVHGQGMIPGKTHCALTILLMSYLCFHHPSPFGNSHEVFFWSRTDRRSTHSAHPCQDFEGQEDAMKVSINGGWLLSLVLLGKWEGKKKVKPSFSFSLLSALLFFPFYNFLLWA